MDTILADKFKNYSTGVSDYSLESIHSDIFTFNGFEAFFERNYGPRNIAISTLIEGTVNHRIRRFDVFKNIVDNPSEKSRYAYTHEAKKLNLTTIFNNFEKNKFKVGTNAILHQWELEAEKHGVDISAEKSDFIALQKKGLECLKSVEQHKKIIDIAVFKLMTINDSFVGESSENKDFIKVKEYCKNNIELLSYPSLVNLAKTGGYGLLDLKNDFNNITLKIVDKIREKHPHAYMTLAETYSKFLKTGTGELTSFFNTKLDEALDADMELSKAQTIRRASIFVDGSVLFIDKNNQHIIPANQSELKIHIEQLNLDLIDFKFRKQPVFGKIFKNKYLEDGSISKALLSANSFLSNYEILKQIKFDKNIFDKGFEEINDYIENSVKTYKVYRYANSILSSKNKHLMTESAYPYFEKFYDEKLKEDFVQDYIGKKLAMLTTPEEFTAFVKQVYTKLYDFGQDLINTKLETINKKALINTPDECVVHIENFAQSKHLGSNNWCISRDSYYFDDYTGYDRRQYFVFDYTKESSDSMSMIGITLTDDGRIHAAHKKNDDSVRNHDVVEKYKIKIICADYDFYKDSLHGALKEEIESELKLLERKKIKTLKNNNI
jgi:hypothetical protein